jgi:hypothetical protein
VEETQDKNTIKCKVLIQRKIDAKVNAKLNGKDKTNRTNSI